VIPRGALLAIAVLGLCASTSARQSRGDAGVAAGQAPQAGFGEAGLWSALSPKVGKDPFDEKRCAKELVAKGSSVARPAIRVYLGDSQEPEHDYDVDPMAIDARPRILVAVLKGLPKADVLAAVDAEETGSESNVDRQLLLVRLLGVVGGKEAVDRVLAIASRLDSVQWERTFVQVPVQDTLAALVRDDPDLQKEIARRVQDAKAGLGGMLVRALVQSSSTAAAPELTYSLGRDPRLDLCLVEALGSLAEGAAGTLSESALQALRAQLGAPDARVVCAAATALGRLGDEASAEKLVRLLGDPDALKQHGALVALAALGGRARAGEPKEWEAWLEAETKWKAERLPDLERVISEEELASMPEVLAELVAHRLFRHRIAMDLTPMLASRNPDIVRLACGILPALGSRAVVPALKAVLRGADRDMIPIARAALIALQPTSTNP
jgi:hypothetical protein